MCRVSDTSRNWLHMSKYPEHGKLDAAHKQHVHAGNTYKLYDNDGAVRCEYHSCPYNIYNPQIGDYPDEPDCEG